jgi:hypothetical protein
MPFRPEDFNSDNIFASEILKYGITINWNWIIVTLH